MDDVRLLSACPGDLGDGTPERPRLVVDVWLAVPTSDGWRALMLRRAARRGGFWQGVSGRVEASDASLEAAARREIGEELGIEAGIEVLDLGLWVPFTGPMSGLRFRKRSLGALLPAGSTPERLALSAEHEEARLVTFEQARALVSFPGNVEELRRLERRLPARGG